MCDGSVQHASERLNAEMLGKTERIVEWLRFCRACLDQMQSESNEISLIASIECLGTVGDSHCMSL
jgi:hypothetical protein